MYFFAPEEEGHGTDTAVKAFHLVLPLKNDDRVLILGTEKTVMDFLERRDGAVRAP